MYSDIKHISIYNHAASSASPIIHTVMVTAQSDRIPITVIVNLTDYYSPIVFEEMFENLKFVFNNRQEILSYKRNLILYLNLTSFYRRCRHIIRCHSIHFYSSIDSQESKNLL